MSIAEKLTQIAENEQKVFDAGYEAGRSDIAALIDRSLTKIEIPKGITTIGHGAYMACEKALGAVNVPEGVTRIFGQAFYACAQISEINFPSSLTYVGSSSLSALYGIDRLVLPPLVLSLTASMAADSRFTEFIAEGAVYEILGGAFARCSKCLKYDLTACKQVPNLRNTNAFQNINPDAKILVPAPLYDEWIAATNWAAYADHIVGVAPLEYALDPDGTAYTVTGIGTYESMGELADIIIPEKHEGLPVISIAPSAFEGNSTIGHVTIPESVTSIGASAFADCTELTRIYFGAANMSDLGFSDGIFARAGQDGDGISVVIGNKVKRLPNRVFYGGYPSGDYSPKVISVEFEEGSVCTEIGDSAFYYCMELESFAAPAALEKIGSYALETIDTVDVLDFSACTQVPALADTYADCAVIYVPAALYDEWIVATNWAVYADRIIAK